MTSENELKPRAGQIVRINVDDRQQENLPMDMAATPFLFKKDLLTGDMTVPWHWHNVYELNYVVEGELLCKTLDSEQVMKKGDVCFINNGVMHSWNPVDNQRCVFYTLLFDMHFLSGIYNSVFEEKYFLPMTRNADLLFWPIRPDSLLHLRMIEAVLQVGEILEEASFGYELRLRNVLSDFWLMLLQDTEEVRAAAPPKTGVDSERIRVMSKYIQEHYAEKLTLEDIASAADISTRECTRCFRRCLNVSPIVYLTQTRLNMAAEMLLHSTKSVIEISEECGFSSPSYFGKVFREMMGTTPKEYRGSRLNEQT